MSVLFFSPRKRYDFTKNGLGIGTWFTWKKSHYKRFVFQKIYQIGEQRFPEFYNYHLNYYQSTQPDAQEQVFHKFLLELLSEDLIRLKGISLYSKKHAQNTVMKDVLVSALSFLQLKDKWSNSETKEATITRQQLQITELENKNRLLIEEVKELKRLETDDYINIAYAHLHPVLDLFLQMQELPLPTGKELMFAQTQAVWIKMICKHFKVAHQPINPSSISRYFPADKSDPGVKHAPVKAKYKLFQIKKTSKWDQPIKI